MELRAMASLGEVAHKCHCRIIFDIDRACRHALTLWAGLLTEGGVRILVKHVSHGCLESDGRQVNAELEMTYHTIRLCTVLKCDMLVDAFRQFIETIFPQAVVRTPSGRGAFRSLVAYSSSGWAGDETFYFSCMRQLQWLGTKTAAS